MAHILSHIKVENYKSIVSEEFELSAYTPLVGYNNAGKSNVLNAIKWLLRKSSLQQDAFHTAANPVTVEGIVTGITAQIRQSLIAAHQTSMAPYIHNETLRIKRIQSNPGDTVANIKLYVYDNSQAGTADEWRLNPGGIDNAISALFPEPIQIGAMENSEEDVSKSKTGTTIGKLLGEIINPIEAQYGAQVQQTLDGLKDILDAEGVNRAQELTVFDGQVNAKIDEFFPGIAIKVHVPTPELKEVFTKGTIKVYENAGTGRDVSSLGRGAQRSVQMALVRHLAEMKRAGQNNTSTTLLLIDEPELYLHPQAIEIVRDALKKLSSQGYQVIFSTHSPMMITHNDVGNTVLVRKNAARGTHRMITLKSAIPQVAVDAPSQLQLLFSLSHSSNILFSERVFLTEGVTEQRIMPSVIEYLTSKSLGLHKFALVKQDGVANTRKSMEVLRVMGLSSKAIVDLDFVFKRSVTDGYLPATDPDLLACHAHLGVIAPVRGITLSGDGWPRKSPTMTAADAIKILASEAAVQPHITNLHTKMLGRDIWIWKRGAIEEHLGLAGKTEHDWANFNNDIKSIAFDTLVPDHVGVRACVTWLTS